MEKETEDNAAPEGFLGVLKFVSTMHPMSGRLYKKTIPFFCKRWTVYCIFLALLFLFLIVTLKTYSLLAAVSFTSISDILQIAFYCAACAALGLSVLSNILIYFVPGNRMRMFLLEAGHDGHYIKLLKECAQEDLMDVLIYTKNYRLRIERRIKLIFGGLVHISLGIVAITLLTFWADFPKIFSNEGVLSFINYFGGSLRSGIAIAFLFYAAGWLGRLSSGYRLNRLAYQTEILEIVLVGADENSEGKRR